MKIISKISFLIIILIIICAIPQKPVLAQDRTIHFMHEIPQAGITNPAIIPNHPSHIGIPALSSIYLGFENSFRYKDLFVKRNDSLYIDRENLISKLKDRNFTGIYTQVDLLSFGFSIKDLYLSFRLSNRNNFNLSYSKDFIKLLTYGNGYEEFLGKTIEFSDTRLNSTVYNEMAVSGAYQIDKKWTAGVSFRYLLGLVNIYSEKADITLTTDSADFSMKAKSDLLIHSSSPVSVGIDGVADTESSFDNYMGTDNPGFAIDLGVTYKPIDKLTVAFSIIDLGKINWTQNARKIYSSDPSKEFVYNGFDINDFITDNSIDQENVSNILDSISDELGIVEGYEDYSTPLPTKILISGTYDYTPKDQFGGLIRNSFVTGRMRSSLTLSYRRELLKKLAVYASYSAFNNSYFNVGLGFAAELGAFQFYMINDNFAAIFMPKNAMNYNLRFGFNFVFGGHNKVKPVEPPIETTF